MSDPFDRAEARDAGTGFLEDGPISLPVDRAATQPQGPLSGLTVGIKSNIRVAGQAWTAGIGVRRDRVAATDAEIVARLRAGGATILSRLKMDEGALGAATDNPHFGRCENPAWPGHSPGGSSGGSAAAVAASVAEVALGTDTLGSVRIPAAYCGLWGLKLGPEAVPMDGVFPLAPSLDAVGILGAGPDPIRAVLDIMAPDVASPLLSGWARGLQTGDVITPEIAAFLDLCAATLDDLLGPARALTIPDLADLRAEAFLFTEIEAVDTLGDESGLSPGLARLIEYGRRVAPERAAQARARLAQTRDEVLAGLGPSTVILMPTVGAPAFAHGTRAPRGQADFTALANVAGCPALALPASKARPPASVQLVGPPESESALLELGARIWARLPQS